MSANSLHTLSYRKCLLFYFVKNSTVISSSVNTYRAPVLCQLRFCNVIYAINPSSTLSHQTPQQPYGVHSFSATLKEAKRQWLKNVS